jgi:murein DD-endopeptidase MepM/ murein hydrolase activator NlpD
MYNKVTFIVLNTSGSQMRRVSFSKRTLAIGTAIILACAISLTVAGMDYLTLRKNAAQRTEMANSMQLKIRQLENERQQVQAFAAEVNTLKNRLLALNEFERKIRVIANLETAEDQDGLFGIGGTLPDDLDTDVALAEAHNNMIREMHEQTGQIEEAAVVQEQGFKALIKELEGQRNILASTPSIRPTKGWLTSHFGYRTSPFTGLREFHKGIDISNRKGTPIIAPANGTVSYVGRKGLLGNVVVIDHGHGIVTRYAHLSATRVKKGQKVERGVKIAEIGNTGRSTGAHLHYEVHVNGLPVNPSKYILN